MMIKKALIWTAGGSGIGMGHVMRCIPVAYEMKRNGIEVLFVVNEDQSVRDVIMREGYRLIIHEQMNEYLAASGDMTNAMALIADYKKDISDVLRGARESVRKTILIDNRTDAVRHADIVVMPSMFEDTVHDEVMKGVNLLQGPGYFPLNPAFMKAAKQAGKKGGSKIDVLITMGGSDPNNITLKILNAIQDMDGISIKVVIGPSMHETQELKEMEAHAEVERNVDVHGMALLMKEADIAFTAFGISLFELACMGVPAIVIANYRDDKGDMDSYKLLGTGIPLGYYEDVTEDDIKNALLALLGRPDIARVMSDRGRMLIDGRGAERIADAVVAE